MMRPLKEGSGDSLFGGAGATDEGFPPRLSQLLRALFAFVCGVLLYTALTSVFSRIAGIEVPPGPGEKKPVAIIFCLAAAMVLAGYGTARISRKWEILLAAALGVLMSLGAGPADREPPSWNKG